MPQKPNAPPLFQAHHTLQVATLGRGLYPFTPEASGWIDSLDAREGLFVAFIQHTSASLLVQENADPDVLGDLERFFAKLVPDGDPLYRHDAEGPDDMPSHVRSALTQVQLSVPVREGALSLGTWQGLYVYEHRRAPHHRRVLLHYVGS